MMEYPQTTKERILEAAGDIFGREGFKAATIRGIAKAARVNIAAINYHFQGKEGLYAAVLEDVFRHGFSRFPSKMAIEDDTPPEQQLRAFIRGMFFRLLSSEGWGGFSGRGKFIARELLDPTPALETVLEKYIKPHKDLLMTIIVAIMREDPGPGRLLSCVISIIGQCVYYALAAPVIAKIAHENRPTEDNLERLAEFVWLFSLGGIERIRLEASPAGKTSGNVNHQSRFPDRRKP